MSSKDERVSTGISGLDRIVDDLRIGDNVVWCVDRMDDYRELAESFVARALADGRHVVLMRFGGGESPVRPRPEVTEYQLDAYRGFESFTTRVHSIIAREGERAFYVFDNLSTLLDAWATDLMIANFFQVTCPYLFDLDTVAYFGLIRSDHSYQTIDTIRNTTQLLLNLYHVNATVYVHPLKVWRRQSPTMFLPHARFGEEWSPLADSDHATRLLRQVFPFGTGNPRRHLDYWDLVFIQAAELLEQEPGSPERREMVERLVRAMIGRDERIVRLACRYFSLEDLIDIQRRVIGTGFIGGKAGGMLLARAILLDRDPEQWRGTLEPHDSFFVGSDVYYHFLVQNGWWSDLMQQKTPGGYFDVAEDLERRIRLGVFTDDLVARFQAMLEYYGQYPIIVRSSSLLEDGFGNAFAGKYDSFFCVNQGTPEQRWSELLDAIRKIYSSTMSRSALTYRRQRGLEKREEQMALLIQRVSGAYRKHFYFPEISGVGVSRNTFVWDKNLDPTAGMLRLVLGLGTRAVDRVAGDYPRLVALDEPLLMPHKGMEDTRRYSQREVDVLDVTGNRFLTLSLPALAEQHPGIDFTRYGRLDRETMRNLESRTGKKRDIWLLTFEKLLTETEFPRRMQQALQTIEAAYEYPVDVEFCANFDEAGRLRLNLVQCRPLQTRGEENAVRIPDDIPEERVFVAQDGLFSGGSVSRRIKRVIYIDPEGYMNLTREESREVTRLIGRLNRMIGENKEPGTLLMGPGRWGTSTPSLGVPVTFADISRISVLAEVAFTTGGMMPELSYGSHFFQDLVENDIFYMAIFPDAETRRFDREWLTSLPNRLEELLPMTHAVAGALRVYDIPGDGLRLMADIVGQRLVCWREDVPSN